MSVAYYALLGEVTLVGAGTDGRLEIAEGVSDDSSADIAAGTYFLRGDGAADDLCKKLKDALEAAAGTVNTYSVTPTFSVGAGASNASVAIARATGSATFILKWASASTKIDPGLFGFAATNTANDALTKTSALTPSCIWVGNEVPVRDDPAFDAVGAQVRMRGGQVRTFDGGGPYDLRELELELITPERTLTAETAADPTRAFERFWRRHRDGKRMELHAAALSGASALGALSSTTRIGTFVFDEPTCEAFRPRRASPGMERYGWTVGLRGYVA